MKLQLQASGMTHFAMQFTARQDHKSPIESCPDPVVGALTPFFYHHGALGI